MGHTFYITFWGLLGLESRCMSRSKERWWDGFWREPTVHCKATTSRRPFSFLRKCMVNLLRGGWKGCFCWQKTQPGGMEFRNSMSQLYQEVPKCLYSNFQDSRDETTRYHVRHGIGSQKDTPCKNASLNLVRQKHQTNLNWQAFYKNQQLFKNLQIIEDKKPVLVPGLDSEPIKICFALKDISGASGKSE